MQRLAVLIIAAPLAVAGCQNGYNNGGYYGSGGGGIGGMGTKQTVGALGGAVAGGVLGAQIGHGTGRLIATGAGTLLGAFLGSEIGRSLDRADRQYAESAFDRASSAPMGQQITWSNPDSGHYGSVTPVREGQTADGRYCREYETSIYVDGRYEQARGRACRNPDGTWQMVS